MFESTTQNFSTKLKTLDKASWLSIVWNYIPEEAIKKSWETQIFGKRCSENLSKAHSESCQTSKLLLKYLIGFWRCFWFWQVMYWHFSSGIYLFKVSTTALSRGSYKCFFWLNCLEHEQVNANWVLINDLEKILFSVSV